MIRSLLRAQKQLEPRKSGFCVADLVDLVKEIPEFHSLTDFEWAYGIARMLKQFIGDEAIHSQRGNGELKAIHQSIIALKTCVHRLEFGLAVQDLRLALHAKVLVLCELVGISE